MNNNILVNIQIEIIDISNYYQQNLILHLTKNPSNASVISEKENTEDKQILIIVAST